jgi:hypothetical protein
MNFGLQEIIFILFALMISVGFIVVVFLAVKIIGKGLKTKRD